jgi:hypothetical protein
MTASNYQVDLLALDEIVPYANNPRNNENAVDAVIASIIQFGFRVPLLVDKDNVLVAGHTRLEAVKRIVERDPSREADLGRLPCFRADDLTEDQVRAFRVVDNKTAELAEWNFDLLADEVSLLAEAGIQLTEFGWSQEEIDCLKSVVSEDCLNPASWEEGGGDGVSRSISATRDLGTSADGSSIRVTVGSFGFMILRDDYDKWFDERMQANSFDFEKANDEVASMLNLKQAKEARVNYLMNFNKVKEAAPAAETQADEPVEEHATVTV